nr:hypothetical protein Iba_scaffold60941CG0010 [Ipomoea batatas]GMC67375.1 hypothetical protein Iba_scaffold60942CG0010 [Ipomoea batatas]GMD56738.1 hypothetical protein Iba_scaffold194384CG0010 [Ipomoea batatas]GMD89703.1 hypothetical protein Iba_chr14dCG2600 [Ipomoea batatas]GME13877.1 hypothetical protein Iba_scaffold14807CG0020 [Ipomoea batatas]
MTHHFAISKLSRRNFTVTINTKVAGEGRLPVLLYAGGEPGIAAAVVRCRSFPHGFAVDLLYCCSPRERRDMGLVFGEKKGLW